VAAGFHPRCSFFVNGNLVFEEHYSDVKTGMAFDSALFDPAEWSTARHWR